MESTNPGALVVWGSGILGFIFGAVANRTNFCTMGAVSDVVNMGSWGRMRMCCWRSRSPSWAPTRCSSRG